MPTLSASDYTQYLKFKAAAGSAIRPAIQTRDNVSLSQSLINAQTLASQAALVTTPANTTVVTLTPTVTNASTTTVTAAQTTILAGATGGTNTITYTTSLEHGLRAGDRVTIQNVPAGILPASNGTFLVASVPTLKTFIVSAQGTTGGTAGAGGNIQDRVYYTTSVAHGLLADEVVSITGIASPYTLTNATILAAGSAAEPTTLVVRAPGAIGSTLTSQTGSITGLVYYTTSAAHGLIPGTKFISVTGLTGYNISRATVYRAPTSTGFVVQNSATGTAVTGGAGVLAVTTFTNPNMALTTNARVQARLVPQVRSTPVAKSTVSFAGTSGALGSSPVQRSGGLPTGFKNSQGTYTRLPQSAGW